MDENDRLTKLIDRLEKVSTENDRLTDIVQRFKDQLYVTELRLFTITELYYLVQDDDAAVELLIKCISACDEDNDWWLHRKDYTLKQWKQTFIDYEPHTIGPWFERVKTEFLAE
jgi:hypothetical protein